ncbi:MAG: hypothetical protein QG664_75, partial [Patescibacteria group bacterium]|nr:hypothetical protein [Patescibacteria group bacterium]
MPEKCPVVGLCGNWSKNKGMPVYKIQKRNCSFVDFKLVKIEDAFIQASKATGKHDEIIAQVLAEDVYARLEEEFIDKIPTVEEVQDIVEDMLIQYGYAETAKAYILYR